MIELFEDISKEQKDVITAFFVHMNELYAQKLPATRYLREFRSSIESERVKEYFDFTFQLWLMSRKVEVYESNSN